jgi:hypothetical protein
MTSSDVMNQQTADEIRSSFMRQCYITSSYPGPISSSNYLPVACVKTITSLCFLLCPVSLSGIHTVDCMFAALIFFFIWCNSPPPQWSRASSFTRFLDHAQRRTTVDRTPLDEWSARCRNYLTTHNTHNKHPCPLWDSNPQSQQANGHWDR